MKRLFFSILFVAALALAGGCQFFGEDTPAAPGDTAETGGTVIDLDDPTGGLTAADEEPAFGEAELYEPILAECDPDGEYAEQARIRDRIRDCEMLDGAKVYRLRMVWGYLGEAYTDSTIDQCCEVDWSGRIHAPGGVVMIERTIAFDPADYVERVDKSTIAVTSRTCPHVDGIQLKIVFPPAAPVDSAAVADSSAATVVPQLVVELGPYSATFGEDDLAASRFTQWVDRCWDGIMVSSYEVPRACPRGYLIGRWQPVEPDSVPADSAAADTTARSLLGIFRGLWVSDRGNAEGWVRGVYGIDGAGSAVFYGKIINPAGKCRGFVRGMYGPFVDFAGPVPEADGWFEGDYLSRDRVVLGDVDGIWAKSETGRGYFLGLWKHHCPEDVE